MENFFKKYLKGDTIVWTVFFILCIFSIIELYSASSTLAFKAASHTAPIVQHFSYLVLGAVLAYVVHLVPYRYIRIFAYMGLLISILLLIYVLDRKSTRLNSSH